jgi:hypothetical protein
VLAEDEPASGLVLRKAPSPPSSATLGAALDALVGRGWRASGGDVARTLAEASAPGSSSILTLDAPASLLLLGGDTGAALDPDGLRLEAVWIDGRPALRRP